jgi:hypothetical protein
MTFVKIAEAVDTPEMHAAITQAFKLGQRGLDMLATDQVRINYMYVYMCVRVWVWCPVVLSMSYACINCMHNA